jgi:hypothetical protein
MRNSTVVLSAADKARATKARKALAGKVNETVTVNFTKRDGTPSTITGQVLGFVGEGDKEAVSLVVTGKGYRSANLWTVKSIKP